MPWTIYSRVSRRCSAYYSLVLTSLCIHKFFHVVHTSPARPLPLIRMRVKHYKKMAVTVSYSDIISGLTHPVAAEISNLPVRNANNFETVFGRHKAY